MTKLPLLCLLIMAIAIGSHAQTDASAHFANGIKVGEVTSDTAIIWTRLTEFRERNLDGKPFPKNNDKKRRSFDYPDLDAMEGAVPGLNGEVRLTYFAKSNPSSATTTDWQPVQLNGNSTTQFELKNLQPATLYKVNLEGRSSRHAPTGSVIGSFSTAPAADDPATVSFAVVTGQDYPRRDDRENGHQVYPQMTKLGIDFFVHTGDIEYYDKPEPFADNIELARFKWNRLYAMPFQREFQNHTASYFIKDDHDTLKNDCWPGQTYGDLTWEDGLKLFPEQVPMGEKTYRTIRWGRDLQIWLVEGRDYRSPNTMTDGPDKTIWGKEQKQWFKETVEASDATFRILISPTPVVGPDRGNKNDNHANSGFTYEGNELRDFIASQKNMFVVCGDRHWQYVSQDSRTGLREYSCGPTTDKHASGFTENQRSDMHRYLKIKGGFLRVEISRVDGTPTVAFRHHGVNGQLYNEDIQVTE